MKTKMEQWFQDNRSYPASCGATAAATRIVVPTLKFFTVTCTLPDATHYTIQADGGSATDSSMSGIAFTINEANARATTVTSGSPMAKAGYGSNATCWTTKKGSEC
jgi:type IV pilus assembly protein PilE